MFSIPMHRLVAEVRSSDNVSEAEYVHSPTLFFPTYYGCQVILTLSKMRYNNVNFRFVICWQMETHMLPFLPACFSPHLRLWFPCPEGKQLPTLLHFELELDKQETIINMYLTRLVACKYPLFTWLSKKEIVCH